MLQKTVDLKTSEHIAICGRRLRIARMMLFRSQAQALRAIGIPKATHEWSDMEQGKVLPSVLYVARLCSARPEVSLDFIYLGRLRGLGKQFYRAITNKYPELLEQDPKELNSDYR